MKKDENRTTETEESDSHYEYSLVLSKFWTIKPIFESRHVISKLLDNFEVNNEYQRRLAEILRNALSQIEALLDEVSAEE